MNKLETQRTKKIVEWFSQMNWQEQEEAMRKLEKKRIATNYGKDMK